MTLDNNNKNDNNNDSNNSGNNDKYILKEIIENPFE